VKLHSCAYFAFAATLTVGVTWAAPAIAQDAGAPQTALVHHAVSTTLPAAQHAFDEGLTLIYSFNRDEAARRFEKAATLDPSLAMAWWGVALAEGPNLNFDMTPERLKKANEALAKAAALESAASAEERRYIAALRVRYPPAGSNDAAFDHSYAAYRAAMAQLHADYPDDPDAATLYAESVMDVSDFGYRLVSPTPDATLVATTLEGVLKSTPGHVGANHYYVHAMDGEGVASRALLSAERLSELPAEPAASHLVHMSGHIYLDLGLFGPLERDNRVAIDDDRTYAQTATGGDPWKLDYFGHNLDFYTGGALMLDDKPEVERAVGFARTNPDRAHYVLAYLREGRWNDVLAWPEPNGEQTFEKMAWTFARGVAYAGLGDVAAAKAQRSALDALYAGKTARYITGYGGALDGLLGARIAHAGGDDPGAIALLRSVVAETTPLPPEAFAPWYFPTGEWLGAILLQSGDAAGAEAAYRADLVRTPHNARALYGLMRSLTRQDRSAEARLLATELVANWRGPLDDLRLGL
jgi:hypothetical protein